MASLGYKSKGKKLGPQLTVKTSYQLVTGVCHTDQFSAKLNFRVPDTTVFTH